MKKKKSNLEDDMSTKASDQVTIVMKGAYLNKGGRPKKLVTTRTNLDLPEEILQQLDEIAKDTASTRQAVLKMFIQFGLSDYYQTKRNEIEWRKSRKKA